MCSLKTCTSESPSKTINCKTAKSCSAGNDDLLPSCVFLPLLSMFLTDAWRTLVKHIFILCTLGHIYKNEHETKGCSLSLVEQIKTGSLILQHYMASFSFFFDMKYINVCVRTRRDKQLISCHSLSMVFVCFSGLITLCSSRVLYKCCPNCDIYCQNKLTGYHNLSHKNHEIRQPK